MPSAKQLAHFKPRAVWAMRLLLADFPTWKVDDAAADVGNAGYESAGFTLLQEIGPIVEGSRGGCGWYMWTGPRRREFEAYCYRNKFDPKNDIANYKFHFLELKGSERHTIDAVSRATTLETKTRAFENAYERAGVKAYDKRIAWARIARDAYYEAEKTAPPPAIIEPDEIPLPSTDFADVVARLVTMDNAQFEKFTLALAHATVKRASGVTTKEPEMFGNTKSIFQSKTIWGIAIAALSLWSPIAGEIAGAVLPGDVTAVNPDVVTDLSQLVESIMTTVCLAVAAWGRITAKAEVTVTGKK